MALFKRRNNPTIAEIENYYEQQSRQSTSRLRMLTLRGSAVLLTAGLMFVLFYGGKLIYNYITDNETVETTQHKSDTDSVGLKDFENNSASSNSGTTTDEASTTNEPNVDRIISSSTNDTSESTTPLTGANIPNTGVGATAVIISMASGFIATIVSYLKRLY